MDISRTQTGIYVGAGAAVGGGLATLRHGARPLAMVLGVTTGIAVGSAQSYVQGATGSGELGWAAAVGAGALTGGVVLGSLRGSSASPMRARGMGMMMGAATGVFGPIAAGIVLAQSQ